ncbi:hypothetical protein [Flavobacterium sp.]|jgi:hypothetical protein|uniref:hypothetical protein n=1 Tax=Flavobacterium sp. TaxID=239 RepID=UPI0037C1238D
MIVINKTVDRDAILKSCIEIITMLGYSVNVSSNNESIQKKNTNDTTHISFSKHSKRESPKIKVKRVRRYNWRSYKELLNAAIQQAIDTGSYKLSTKNMESIERASYHSAICNRVAKHFEIKSLPELSWTTSRNDKDDYIEIIVRKASMVK